MFALKDYITSEDVKNLRKNLGLTQKEFASLVGTSKPTIERWEKENAKITGPIVLLSKMINDYPDYVNRLQHISQEPALKHKNHSFCQKC